MGEPPCVDGVGEVEKCPGLEGFLKVNGNSITHGTRAYIGSSSSPLLQVLEHLFPTLPRCLLSYNNVCGNLVWVIIDLLGFCGRYVLYNATCKNWKPPIMELR
jgi:hypothetical protein